MIWGNLVLADVIAILPLGLQLVVLFFFLAGVIASCFVFCMADGDVVAICLMFVLAYVIAICFCGCWYYHLIIVVPKGVPLLLLFPYGRCYCQDG